MSLGGHWVWGEVEASVPSSNIRWREEDGDFGWGSIGVVSKPWNELQRSHLR